jgi:hypothetical protein
MKKPQYFKKEVEDGFWDVREIPMAKIGKPAAFFHCSPYEIRPGDSLHPNWSVLQNKFGVWMVTSYALALYLAKRLLKDISHYAGIPEWQNRSKLHGIWIYRVKPTGPVEKRPWECISAFSVRVLEVAGKVGSPEKNNWPHPPKRKSLDAVLGGSYGLAVFKKNFVRWINKSSRELKNILGLLTEKYSERALKELSGLAVLRTGTDWEGIQEKFRRRGQKCLKSNAVREVRKMVGVVHAIQKEVGACFLRNTFSRDDLKTVRERLKKTILGEVEEFLRLEGSGEDSGWRLQKSGCAAGRIINGFKDIDKILGILGQEWKKEDVKEAFFTALECEFVFIQEIEKWKDPAGKAADKKEKKWSDCRSLIEQAARLRNFYWKMLSNADDKMMARVGTKHMEKEFLEILSVCGHDPDRFNNSLLQWWDRECRTNAARLDKERIEDKRKLFPDKRYKRDSNWKKEIED